MAHSFLLPSAPPSSPLLCLESLGFLPGNYWQAILSLATCQIERLKEAAFKKKKNLYTKVSKALAGFVSKEKKKEKTCLPNFLVSVTKRLSDYTLRMKQPYFFMTLKKKSHFFQVPWGLGVSDFKPTAKTNPPAHIPPLLDGCKATVLTTICPFATLVTKTTYLVTILQSLKNISFRVVCLFNVYFRAT